MSNTNHIGNNRNLGTRYVMLYNDLYATTRNPADDGYCVVLELDALPDLYRDEINTILYNEGQKVPVMADLLSKKNFGDGNNIMSTIMKRGWGKKIRVEDVDLVINPTTRFTLKEINDIVRKNNNIPAPFKTGSDNSFVYEDAPVIEPAIPMNVPPVKVVSNPVDEVKQLREQLVAKLENLKQTRDAMSAEIEQSEALLEQINTKVEEPVAPVKKRGGRPKKS